METQFVLQHCWNIWDKIKAEFLSFNAATDAFSDGLIDALYSPGNWQGKNEYEVHPSMRTVLQLKKGIHYIGLSREDIDRGAKATGWPISPMTVPAGAFQAGLPERDTLAFPAQLMACAYKDMDNELVYEIVKTVHENIKKFGEAHASMKMMSPRLMGWLPAVSEEEIHPGALKYYKEKGIPIMIAGSMPEF